MWNFQHQNAQGGTDTDNSSTPSPAAADCHGCEKETTVVLSQDHRLGVSTNVRQRTLLTPFAAGPAAEDHFGRRRRMTDRATEEEGGEADWFRSPGGIFGGSALL